LTSDVKWAARVLDGDQSAILTHLEESTPVRLMATMGELAVTYKEELVTQAVKRAEEGRYDYLPVRSMPAGPIIGLFRRSDAEEKGSVPVACVMQPLSGANLIGANAPLLDFVYTADTSPCRLVLDRSEIRGVVTVSDIQRLPVRTVLFSQFIHLELLLTENLRTKFGGAEDILQLIPEPRRSHAMRRWKRSVTANMDHDPFNVLMFTDKKLLASYVEEFAPVREKMKADFTAITRNLRNPIAHGDEFALTVETALAVVVAARHLRKWIEYLSNVRQPLHPTWSVGGTSAVLP
jgi:hypothetical protein